MDILSRASGNGWEAMMVVFVLLTMFGLMTWLEWLLRNMLFGLILGFVARLLHAQVLKRLEEKFLFFNPDEVEEKNKPTP